MCGINGFNFIDKKILKRMNDSIKHRGPEQEGSLYNAKEKVSLGHRRLAIIELSEKGAQPKSYSHKGKKVTITFNGEIYNYQEIRGELIKKGYKFRFLFFYLATCPLLCYCQSLQSNLSQIFNIFRHSFDDFYRIFFIKFKVKDNQTYFVDCVSIYFCFLYLWILP